VSDGSVPPLFRDETFFKIGSRSSWEFGKKFFEIIERVSRVNRL